MNRLAICLPIIGFALTACGSDPEPQSTAATTQAAAKAAAVDPMARMARAVGSGKPGAALDIRYDFGAKPAVGTPSELQIAFIPNAGVDSLEIVVSGMDGVTLSGPLSANFSEVQPHKPYLHTLTVLPDRGGVFYVTVVATTQIGNQNLSRTFSIPFVVGNVPAQQQKGTPPQTDAAGEAIQPMKATETTKSG